MEEVGEFHVNGSHGACVLHDPVFVHIRGIVVAGGAGRKQRMQRRDRREQNSLFLGFIRRKYILCA